MLCSCSFRSGSSSTAAGTKAEPAVQLLAQRAINERNVIVSNPILINEQTNPEGVKRF
jgi:hypothetical protein